MARHAVFVDLPNFYSHLVTSGIGEAEWLREYALCWMDFDRLARRLTGEFCSVWVFQSGRRLGPSTARVDGEYLDRYVDRMNSLKGVTAYDVDIEGKQREVASYQCEKCGHKGVAQWESEKGIDASLTVHLFDTMDTWDVAYLLSADADFVPAVRTLRRRGKTIVGAGFSAPSSALVRECYDYVDLHPMFLEDDLAAYEMFRQGGVVQAWLADPVVPELAEASAKPAVELTAQWRAVRAELLAGDGGWQSMCEVAETGPYHRVELDATGPADHGSREALGPADLGCREALVTAFRERFPQHVEEIDLSRGACRLVVSPLAWHGVERRLQAFGARLEGAFIEGPWSRFARWTVKYRYDAAAHGYVVVAPQPSC